MTHPFSCVISPGFRLLSALVLILAASPDFAMENSTNPGMAFRVQHDLSETSTLDATISVRFNEAFLQTEREIAEVRYGKSLGSVEFTAAYNLQFDRRDQAGVEHRTWQQLRRRVSLRNSAIESSVRIEERYFTASDKAGARLRILNRWTKPLSGANQMRLGYEWIFNFNDISNSTRRGVSQNRLSSGVQHTLASGNRVDFEYQLQYQHIPFAENRIQHRLQLTYTYNL